MGRVTNIAWTRHTWNPWMGCSKVSPGCKNCYMFRDMRRYGGQFDPTRVVRGKTTFNKPDQWQRNPDDHGMVFTCSWSDWFHEGADKWRDEAWQVIKRCPDLIFQVLTKRSGRILDHLPNDWQNGYHNVWLGVSVENEDYIWRADDLRDVPAVVRFVSYEPALGPLDKLDLTNIDWVIYGGESGPQHRPEGSQDDPKCWARAMRDKCQRSKVAFFHKQSAALKPEQGIKLDGELVQEFPTPRSES